LTICIKNVSSVVTTLWLFLHYATSASGS